MGTVNRELAQIMKDNNGVYLDDPIVVRIVEYDNAFGGVGYGLEHEHTRGVYTESPYVRNPRVFFERTG